VANRANNTCGGLCHVFEISAIFFVASRIVLFIFRFETLKHFFEGVLGISLTLPVVACIERAHFYAIIRSNPEEGRTSNWINS
jgi:hypothetical protein